MFSLIVSVAALGLIIYIIIVYERRLRLVRGKSDRSGALEKARIVRAEKKEERKVQIVAFLGRRKTTSLEDIRNRFEVSESTASRYMQELVEEQRVALIHKDGLSRYAVHKEHRSAGK